MRARIISEEFEVVCAPVCFAISCIVRSWFVVFQETVEMNYSMLSIGIQNKTYYLFPFPIEAIHKGVNKYLEVDIQRDVFQINQIVS